MWNTNFSTDTLKNSSFDRNYIGRPQKLKLLFFFIFQQTNTEYHKVYELRKNCDGSQNRRVFLKSARLTEKRISK